ncbi:PPC domain-containing DNA-binding protein [Erysipelothrix tonsillarum]|uniref:PPC domain-containing DNA-binding protein n=1 Tax=Erysipelothrix tonsillarum TaxID=38402 RepID=UPI000380AC5A|nr:PPC domain-containing DNA-binding protein [Erysipelothrix tonsillarum]
MKEHVIRLMPGDDLLQGIDAYCKKFQITSGYIGTCVGSLSRIVFRKGHNKKEIQLNGPYEIVSCVGTVSKGGHHIHASVSDLEFKVLGGHVSLGCIVKSTAEIVIIELEHYQLTRTKGELSGYKELEIEATGNVCKES